MKDYISCKHISKKYAIGNKDFYAINHIDFTIPKGEFVIILGPSGAGKSTLLNLLGGMDSPTSGDIIIDGNNISSCTDDQLTSYRAADVGFVFQFYNLIPNLTAYENVALIKEVSKNAYDAKEILESVGLKEHLHQFPNQLSGGEQQRVSIARAISKNPKLLLCDEPTGALDSETGTVILSLLQKMNREKGHTVLIVTHNAEIAETADRVIQIRNGKIRDNFVNENPKPMEEVNW